MSFASVSSRSLTRSASVLIAVLMLWAASAPAAVAPLASHTSAAKFRPYEGGVQDEYIVLLDDLVQDVDGVAKSMAARHGGSVVTTWHAALKGFWLRIGGEGARSLSDEPLVRVVEQNMPMTSAGQSAEASPRFSIGLESFPATPWNIQRISARRRADMTPTYAPKSKGDGAVIYVIDSGQLRFHQEWWPDNQTSPPPDPANPNNYVRVENVPGSNIMTGEVHDAAADLDLDGLPVDTHPSDSPFAAATTACPAPPDGAPWFNDCEGLISHGSACGSAAAGRGVGVARGATVMPIKVNGTSTPDGSTAYFMAAFDFIVGNEQAWANAHNAHRRGAVISMSTYRTIRDCASALYNGVCHGGIDLDSPFLLIAFEEAVQRALAYGIPIAVSGNNNITDACIESPARLSYHGGFGTRHVISVGGIAQSADTRWIGTTTKNPGSNYGTCIDIWAPAENIPVQYTRSADDYRPTNSSGTSFSAPMVAGILARMMSDRPDLYVTPLDDPTKRGNIPSDLWNALRASASHLDRATSNILELSPDFLAYMGDFTIDAEPADTLFADGAQLTVHADSASCRWYAGQPGDTGQPVAEASGSNCTLCFGSGPGCIASLSATTSYWARLTNGTFNADSTAAKVIVGTCGVIKTQPHSTWAAPNTDVTLSVEMLPGDPPGQTPLWDYQWESATATQSGSLNLNFTPIAGAAHQNTYTANDADTKAFRVTITSQANPSCTYTSEAVEVRRFVAPALKSTVPQSNIPFGDVRVGTQVTLSLPPANQQASGEQVRYQWFDGAYPDTTHPLRLGAAFATQSPLTFIPFATFSGSPRTFWARAYTSNSHLDSSSITLKGCDAPDVIPLKEFALNLHAANNGLTSIAVPRPVPATPWQWRRQDGTSWNVIQSGGDVLLVTATKTETSYALELSGTNCSVASPFVVVANLPDDCPSVLQRQAGDQYVFYGAQVILDPQYTNDSHVNAVDWYQGLVPDVRDVGTTTPFASGLRPSFTATHSIVLWSHIRSQCTGVEHTADQGLEFSLPATIAVTSACDGYFDLRLVSNGSTFSQPFTLQAPRGDYYRWYQQGNSVPIQQGTKDTLDVPGITQTTSYYVEVDHKCDGVNTITSTSYLFTASLCSPRPRPVSYPPAAVPANSAQTLSVPDYNDGTTFNWYAGHDYNDLSHPAGSGASIVIYPAATSYYWVRMSKTCGGQTTVLNSAFALVQVQCTGCAPPRPFRGMIKINGIGTTYALLPPTGGIDLEAPDVQPGNIYEWHEGAAHDISTQVLSTLSTCHVNSNAPGIYWVRTTHGTDDTDSFSLQLDTQALLPPGAVDVTVFPSGQYMGSPGVAWITATQPPSLCSNIQYQWWTGIDYNDPAKRALTGETNNILVLQNLDDTATFWVEVTGNEIDPATGTCTKATTLTSRLVKITVVCEPPAMVGVSTYPLGGRIEKNQFVRLSAWGLGKHLSYNWFQGQIGDTSMPIGWGFALDVYPQVDTSYWSQVIDECGNVGSSGATIYVCKPTITQQPPSNVVLRQGQTKTVSVTATPAQPGQALTYQWYSGGAGNYLFPIQGQTTPSLDVSQGGAFWVSVGATCGDGVPVDTPSRIVYVGFCSPPTINFTTHSGEVRQGYRLSISVNASGPDLTYQWYTGPKSDTSHPISGATDASYSFFPMETTTYWVRVFSQGECWTDSDAFTLTVCAPPNVSPITVSGGSSIVFSGDSVTLTENATATTSAPLHYTWYQLDDQGGMNAVGTDAPTFITPALTAPATYFVRVWSGTLLYTDAPSVTLSVCALPHILPTPPNQNVWYGQAAVLTVSLDPPNGNTITWYRGAYPDESTPVSTAINNPGYVFPAYASGQYWAKVVHDDTCVSHTGTTTVTVCVPSITAQPTGGQYDAGAPAPLSVTATAPSGYTAAFQWYAGSPGNTTTPVPNGAAASINVTPSSTTTYFCRVSTSCQYVDSEPVTITVCQRPAITATSGALIAPGSPGTVSVTATGDNLTYQWYGGTSGTTNWPINGAVWPSLQQSPSSTSNYWCRVTSPSTTNCHTDSPTVTITVCGPPTITAQPSSPPVSSGGSANLNVTASGATGYQWYRGTAGDYSTPLNGQNGTSLNTGPLTADTNFFVRVLNGPCGVDSDTVTVHVCILSASISFTPGSQVRKAQSVTLTASATNARSTDLTYSWYSGTSGDISHFAGSGSSTLTFIANSTTQYWVRIGDGICTADSPTATVDVCVPQITTHPQGTVVPSGTPVNLTVAADLTNVTYQWYRGSPPDTTSPVTNQVSATYAFNATSTQTYWARVTGCTSANSNPATVTVCTPPTVNATNQTVYITYGGTATISVYATGTNMTFQWYNGVSGNINSPISGATGSYLQRSPAVTSQYWCRVWSNGACPADSQTITVDVCDTPNITTQPGSPTINYGQSTQLSVAATANTGTVTYQWYRGGAGDTSTPAGTGSTLTTGALTADTTYWARATRGACTADSNPGTVTVCNMSVSVGGVNARSGQVVTLYATPTNQRTGSPYYEWFRGNANDTSYPLGAGTNMTSLQYTVTATTSIWVRMTDQTCIVSSTPAAVSMCIPTISVQPESKVITAGSQWTLSVTALGTGLSYQWYVGNTGTTTTPIGTNSPQLTVQPSQTTTYWVYVTGCGTPASSNAATITVCQPPSVSAPTTMLPVISGNWTSVTAHATGTSLSYQWYRGQPPNTSAPVFTNASYVEFRAYQSDYYWVRVSGACGDPVNSSAVMVSVYPNITGQPQDVGIPSGTSTNLTVTASGTYLRYQWYRGLAPWDPSSTPVGTNSPTFITPNLTQNTSYWVRVWSGDASGDSNTATVSICAGPSISQHTQVMNSSCWYVIVDVYDYSIYDVTFDWYQGQPGDTSNFLGSGTYYMTVCPTVQTTYWARVWTPDHTCYSMTGPMTVH